MNKCKEHDYHWYSDGCNEAGWKCTACDHQPGEPPGFSPQLDRERIFWKVGAVLHDMTDADLISVSNGSEGDCLTAQIADRCVAENLFDQYSIQLFLLREMTPSHAEYWKEIGEGILTGNDPRDRCHCGKLATGHQFDANGKASYCSFEHAPKHEMPF
jgi:hypothetical protein